VIEVLTWEGFRNECGRLARRAPDCRGVWGIPTGGSFVAVEVAGTLGVALLEAPRPGCLVVDDVVDSGETMRPYAPYAHDALFRKPTSPPELAPLATITDGWVQFPWEAGHGPADAIVRLLTWIGEDVRREGLRDTPDRVLRAWKELTAGYAQDPKAILARTFAEPCDEMAVVRDIPFRSTCEHHLFPFTGVASIGYIPDGRVVGLSKLARLVDCYALRLQLQERMTRQIAEAVMEHLSPKAVGVVVRGLHTCMSHRGVRKDGAAFTTSSMLGAMRDEPAARAEFLALIGEGGVR
jgi:GTP cyclohydrolase I